MKEKIKFVGFLFVALFLLHLILVVGCGKNPILSAVVGSGTVEVIRY